MLLDDCDPNLLMWAIRRNADPRWLPDERFVVRFELHGMPRGVRFLRLWWLGGEVDVCLHDAGSALQVTIAKRVFDLRDRPCVKPARFAELARRPATTRGAHLGPTH